MMLTNFMADHGKILQDEQGNRTEPEVRTMSLILTILSGIGLKLKCSPGFNKGFV